MYSDRFKPECTHLGFDRWQKSQKNEIGQGNVGKAQKFQEAQKGLSAQILLGICLSLEIRVLVNWYGESISHESSRSLSGEFKETSCIYYFATSQSPHFHDSLYQSTTSVCCVPHPCAVSHTPLLVPRQELKSPPQTRSQQVSRWNSSFQKTPREQVLPRFITHCFPPAHHSLPHSRE